MDPHPTYNHANANLLRRALRRSAGWKPFSWTYARILQPLDNTVWRMTRGKATFTSWLADLPVAWLTTTGAKSGVQRTSPVVAIPTGDGKLIVIASNYGQQHNPAWYHNLRKNPRTRVLFDGVEREMVARELEDEAERARWYERGIEIYPGWVQYRKRAPRRIPVIELTP
jgi:deazaflavin-dependent oxidoreductase (nitroreductase family)